MKKGLLQDLESARVGVRGFVHPVRTMPGNGLERIVHSVHYGIEWRPFA
jgi:hypothetical protein